MNLANSKTRLFFSYGGMQLAQLMLPLLALPWLSRILGAESFGLLMYIGITTPIAALLMDWGIPLAASRMTAHEKFSKERLPEILGAVFCAKILLALFCIVFAGLCLPFIPHAQKWPFAFFCAVFAGIARSITPFWFYQGTEKNIKELAIWDIGSTIIAVFSVFIFITKPEDWPLYFVFFTVSKGAAYGILNFRLWQKWHPVLNFRNGLNLLAISTPLFCSSFFNMVYIHGSQLVLGYFLSAADMGIYVSISKMLRALVSLLDPVSQFFFPKICSLKKRKNKLVKKIIKLSLGVTFVIISILTVFCQIFAPLIILVALGNNYENAVPIFRIMIAAAPVMAICHALGPQAFVARNKEKMQTLVLGITAMAGIGLACLLPLFFGLKGSAFLQICSETIALLAYCYFLFVKKDIFVKIS